MSRPGALEDIDARVASTNWLALRYFNIYRIVISGLFAVLSTVGKMPPNLSALDARLFSGTSLFYVAATIAAQVAIERRQFRYRVQVYGLSMLDIVAITLLMHAAGGVTSGLGMLLVVAVAGTCLLASGRAGVFVAALASIAFLGETVFGTFYLGYSSATYTQAGLLGAACFGTAILASVLAERARRGEALAAERAIDIENLSRLNAHIVQRMRSGIIALDAEGRLVTMNDAAGERLGGTPARSGTRLEALSATLGEAYSTWLRTGENPDTTLGESGRLNLIVSFTELNPAATAHAGTLVFLEDAAETRQRAQQLKLASLGRLTASIAHEIRNPLAAITHAGQLLRESETLDAQDQRLTDIVLQHAKRVNTIVENVLALGRRKDVMPESFDLEPWLEAFRDEFVQRNHLAADDLHLVVPDNSLEVRMDKSQLHQVLWNLCENGLRYAEGVPKLRLVAGVSSNERPYLDVVDMGPGIAEDIAEHLFEPFATSEAKGTGLGLYVAREMCESNQASLELLPSETGCCFRVIFAHPNRQQRIGDL